MNKNVKIITAVCIVILGSTNISSVQVKTENQQTKVPGVISKALTNYTWYRDEEMTDPVGSVSDINEEIDRLYELFSGYTFSSADGMGLLPFEYGHKQNLPPVIIYSNLY